MDRPSVTAVKTCGRPDEGVWVWRPFTVGCPGRGPGPYEDEATGAYEGTNIFLQSWQMLLRRLSSSS